MRRAANRPYTERVDLELGPRADSELRCALCHDALGRERYTCPSCRTLLHPECYAARLRCPTLGCRESRLRVRARSRRSAARLFRYLGEWALSGLIAALIFAWLVDAAQPGLGVRDLPLEEEVPARAGAPPSDFVVRGSLQAAGRAPRALRLALRGLEGERTSLEARVEVSAASGAGGYAASFSTGWLTDCAWVQVRPYPGRGDVQVLEIQSERAEWNPARRLIYGLTRDDRLVLLRIEDERGDFVLLNTYTTPWLSVGPAVDLRSPEAWAEALAASDPAVVLEALNWLGGEHREPSRVDDTSDPDFESQESALSAARARASRAVAAAVQRLRESPDRWIAEAAWAARAECGPIGLEALLQARDWAGALAHLEELRIERGRLLPGELDVRGRLHLRAQRLEFAEQDYAALVEARGGAWELAQRGRVRLLRGARESGLADLRAAVALDGGDPWAPLWLAALSGALPSDPPLGREAWLGELWRFLRGELAAEDLPAQVERAMGASPLAIRRCVIAWLLGVVAEREGREAQAVEHYQASLDVRAAWCCVQFDWARSRLRDLR